jgi:hypothetical protein
MCVDCKNASKLLAFSVSKNTKLAAQQDILINHTGIIKTILYYSTIYRYLTFVFTIFFFFDFSCIFDVVMLHHIRFLKMYILITSNQTL